MKKTLIPLLVLVEVVMVVYPCLAQKPDDPAEEPDDLPSGYVMKLERSGGYLGRHDLFWIYPDGKVLNSVRETAWIPSESVTKWLDILLPAAVRKSEKKSSIQMPVCMDCYRYQITVYQEDTARVLSFTYPFIVNEDKSVKDIGWIYETLLNLSWE